MTVRAREDLGIFHTSGSNAIVINLLVEGAATLHDVAISVALLLKLVEDGHVAVSAAFCRYAVNIFEGVVQTIHAWYAVLLRIIESVEHLTCHLIYICVRVRDEGVVNL